MLLWHSVICIAVYFLIPQSLVSCSVYDSFADSEHERVEFVLPQWPDELPELLYWQVEMLSAKGKVVQNLEAASGKSSFVYKVGRNELLSVCAAPVTAAGSGLSGQVCFFKCAGTIYPAGCKELKRRKSRAELTWCGGYAASLLQTLIKGSDDFGTESTDTYLASFNWERLLSVLETRSQEESSVFFNPWLLDTQSVLEGIAYHSFNANKLKMTGVFNAPMEFKLFSSYVPENVRCLAVETLGNVTLRKKQATLFALSGSQGLIIYGSSEKNISLEVISMPIF